MKGYSALAWRMSEHPELAIVRKFQALHIQNLLYLQTELMSLEAAFREDIQIIEETSQEPEQWSARDWRHFSQLDAQGAPVNCAWKLFLDIRAKLKEYGKYIRMEEGVTSSFVDADEALKIQAFLLNHDRPKQHDLDIINSNFDDPDMEDYLLGPDRKVWREPQYASDLVALKHRTEFDPASKWLIDHILPTYHRLIGSKMKRAPYNNASIYNYSDIHLRRPVKVLATFGASLLPTSSIVTLYFIHSIPTRLGMTAVFTSMFSILIALITDAKLGDIFAATAA